MPAAIPLVAAVASAAGYTYTALALTAVYVGAAEYERRKAERAQQEAYENSIQGRTVTMRTSNAARRMVFGRQRMGGDTVAYAVNHGDGNRRITLVIPLVFHRVDGFEKFWLGDTAESVDVLDGSSTSSGGGGWTTGGSEWAVSVTQVLTKGITGAGVGATVALGQTITQVLALAYLVVDGDQLVEQRLTEGVDFSVSGATLTWLVDHTGLQCTFTGQYEQVAKLLRLKFFLGLEGGERDEDLEVDSGGEWSSTDVMCRTARVHATLEWDQQKFGQIGIPNLSFTFRGMLTRDYADGSLSWSRCPARALAAYLTATDGLGWDVSRIHTSAMLAAQAANAEDVPSEIVTADAAANTVAFADQFLRPGDPVRFYNEGGAPPAPLVEGTTYYVKSVVGDDVYTLSATAGGSTIDITDTGSGITRVMEPRYTCDTVLSTDADPTENVRILLSAMVGNISKIRGKFLIRPGVYEPPVYTLTEDDLSDEEGAPAWTIDPETPNDSLINGVRGTYVDASPTGLWAVTSYEPYQSATYLAQDGGRVAWSDIPLVATLGRQRAQRIAKLLLHLSRLSLKTTAPFNVRASPIEPLDTIHFQAPTLRWDVMNSGAGKIFRVDQVVRDPSGRVDIQMHEEAEIVYDWSFDEATGDPAPNTAFPDPNVVAPLGPMSLLSSADTYETLEGGRIRPYAVLSWPQIEDDSSVLQGGRIEIEWRPAVDSAWQRLANLDPSSTEVKLYGVAPASTLIAKATVYNGIGAPSPITIGVFGVSADLPSSESRASGNLVAKATLVDPAGWTVRKDAAIVEAVTWQKSGETINTVPGSLLLYQQGTTAGEMSAEADDEIPMVGGQRYAVFASYVTARAQAFIEMRFYDAAGGQIGVPRRTGFGTNVTADFLLESAMAQLGMFVSAPANAAKARLRLGKTGTSSSTDSGVLWMKPFVGPVDAGQSTFPIWNAGGAGVARTQDIAPGATFEIAPYRNAALVRLTFQANTTIASRPGSIGPYTVATTVVLTGQCRVTYGNVPSGVPKTGPRFNLQCVVNGVTQYSIVDAAPDVTAASRAYQYQAMCRLVIELPAGQTIAGVALMGINDDVGSGVPEVAAGDAQLSVEISKGR